MSLYTMAAAAMIPESIRKVGPYEVLSTLGQGGMGTVYLARDTRLGRQVALKFLTGRAVSLDADAQAQLLREARAVSALNHPNICQVYDVGGEGSEAWVAMEYIEGDSLAARLRARGPLPASEVAALGKQIAEALAHAHHRGILHRDLKGANIVCDRDGRPKILDFGIARRLVADISNEVTRTTEVSSPGVEGTLAYMAPEAVRGEPQDERSDLWSLGVVFYELLTGRLPFQGRNTLDLAAAIITASPPSIPDSVPPALATVVRRLLSKEPSARYNTAAAVAAALTVPSEVEANPPKRTRPMLIAGRVAAGALIAAVGLYTAWRLWSRHPLQLSEQKLVSTDTPTAQSPSYSPDRSALAFAAPDAAGVTQVWIQQVAAGTTMQVTRGTAAASRPRWISADRVLFALAGQGIWSVAIGGGTPTRLIERGTNPNISRDGRFIVFEDQRSIWIAAADGSGVRKVDGTTPLFYPVPRTPAISPDGSTIVFFQAELGPNGDFWTIPSSGGTPTRLTSDLREGGSPAWTPDGRTIVFSSARAGSRTLWQIPATGGEPSPLTVGAGDDDQPDVAADGQQIAYSNVRHKWDLRVKNLATGAERTLMQRGVELLFPMFSHDGRRIAVFGRADYAVAIFSIGTNGEELRQLTADRELNHMPRWGADGDVYFFQAAPTRTFRRVSPVGGPSTEFRPWQWETHSSPEFDPTGRFIAYVKQSSSAQHDRTMIQEVATGQERAWAEPHTHPGGWSRDGLSIVGSQHGGAGGDWVAVCMVADGSCRKLTQGRMPRWSAGDGRIYFVRPSAAGATDLWTIAADGTDERRLFTLGTFRAIDVFFDVSKQGEVVWAPFYPGERQVWSATVR